MTKRTPIIGGNWKMNTIVESSVSLANAVASDLVGCGECDVVVYPPLPFLQAVHNAIDNSSIALGAQNMWYEESGAFTGETSAKMLKDVGVVSVLAGHSERRHLLGETNEIVAKKVVAGLQEGLQVVLCVGETLQQREAGETLPVVLSQVEEGLAGVELLQMDNIVIAYEPVWAIGTGKMATPSDAQEVHTTIRSTLAVLFDENISAKTRIQYGGSVKPENATELFSCEDIDGALVGGASLSADSFSAIVKAAINS